MFTQKQLERYADVLLWGLDTARTRKFKKNDIVLIRYHRPGVELAEVLFRRLLEMGLNPVQRMMVTPTMEHDFYSRANPKQLIFQHPSDRVLYENLHGSIYIHSPESLTHLKDIDPGKIGKAAVAFKPTRDILNRREEEGRFSWTLCVFPTREMAAKAGLSLEDYTRQIVRACFLNRTSPLEHWRDIFKRAKAIKSWLNKMDITHLHIESAHADLEVTPGRQRRWVGISGRNIPSFEIFLSPDWRGTRGVYYADQASYRSGNYVEGVRLEFKGGIVTNVQAKAGRTFVRKQISMDKGAARLGEFSLTDKSFSKIDRFMANTLFDENYGGKHGNCHVALGSSYSNTFDGDPRELTPAMKKKLGFNDSALHWDLVNTEKKTVTAHLADGRRTVIYDGGRFMV
jgi:aminopeptidase